MTAAALELRSVTTHYDRAAVLRGVDLFASREFRLADGKLGACATCHRPGIDRSIDIGTTNLKTASGLVRPTAGNVLIDGKDVSHDAPHARATRGLCHIPEGRGVFRSMTVRENLRLQAEKGDEDAALDRAVDAFPVLGNRLDERAGP